MDAPVIGKCNVVGYHAVDTAWAPQPHPILSGAEIGIVFDKDGKRIYPKVASVTAPNAMPEQNAQIAQLERLHLKLIEVREEAEKTAAALAKLAPAAGIDWTKIKIG